MDRNILALPVRSLGWPAGPDPSLESRHEYASSFKLTKPLVEQIVSQSHQLPEDSLTRLASTRSAGRKGIISVAYSVSPPGFRL